MKFKKALEYVHSNFYSMSEKRVYYVPGNSFPLLRTGSVEHCCCLGKLPFRYENECFALVNDKRRTLEMDAKLIDAATETRPSGLRKPLSN